MADGAPVAGQTIRESGIRTRTGVSAIAVQRGTETHPNPDPSFAVQSGDVLVVGSATDHEAFEAYMARAPTD